MFTDTDDYIEYMKEYQSRLTHFLDDNLEYFFLNDQEVSMELSSINEAYIINEINNINSIIQSYERFQQNARTTDKRIFGRPKTIIKGSISTENIGEYQW